MAQFDFSKALPTGAPKWSQLPGGGGGGGSRNAGSTGNFDFSKPIDYAQFGTGRNLGGTSNGWDTPFYREFVAGYEKAMSDRTADTYFLNRRTGIAMVDQRGKDDQGQEQVVRAGDIFEGGVKRGNLYDQYGKDTADKILTPLMLSAQEQTRGVTIDQKRAEVQANAQQAEGVRRYNREVEQKKKDFGDTWDTVAPVGGAIGGAAIGGGAGALFGPLGILIGGAIGGVAGGVAAFANRDELEDMAARGEVQADMMDRYGRGGAALSKRVETYAGLANEFMNPIKQAVHGAADAALGVQGDNESGYYAVDEKGDPKRGAGWTAADFGGNVAGGLLQFISPVGRIGYMGAMGGQITGKVGGLVGSGGMTFDDSRGDFDNIFFNDKNEFDPVSAAAGLGSIGIDVLQMGMGGAMGKIAPGVSAAWRGEVAVSAATRSVHEAGYKFTLGATGKAVSHRLSVTALAPSEAVQAAGVRATAMMLSKKGSAALTSDDLYRAAVSLSSGSRLRVQTLVNAFGESTEEAVQVALDSISHNQEVDLREMADAALAGAAKGAGMTLGAAAGARGRAARVNAPLQDHALVQANALRVELGLPEFTSDSWSAMTRDQRATASAASPEMVATMKAGAAMAAEKMTRDVVAGEAAIERLSDSMHATVASERQTLNDAVDGMYVIAKAAYGIDDHMVVSSIRTTQDLFERHAAGLAEQVETSQDPDLKAQLEWSAKTAAGWAKRVKQYSDAFYDAGTTEKQKMQLVEKLNRMLRWAWKIDPSDVKTINRARGVSMTFLRNPADNPGSFQLLLPQVSLGNSLAGADNLLQITLGPTQAMGGDFDGDKIGIASRVEMDQDTMLALRTGRNLLGAMSDVNVMTRTFEKQEFELLGAAFTSSNTAQQAAAEAVIKDLRVKLSKMLRVNGVAFAKQEQAAFLREARQGVPSAKENLLRALAKRYPSEMRAIGEKKWTNPWFELNSFVHRRLQHFQFTQAAQNTIQAEQHLVSPVKAESEIGKVMARQAASISQTVSLHVGGSDLFRKWQALHYSWFRSPELSSKKRDITEATEWMSAMYEALSSGESMSTMAQLLAKDDLTASVATKIERLSSSTNADYQGQRLSIPLLANMMMPEVQGSSMSRVTLTQWLLREEAAAQEVSARQAGTWETDLALQSKLSRVRSMNPGEAFVEVYGSYSFQELMGLDSLVFGENVTVAQFIGQYVNQSDRGRTETARMLKLHASYKAMNREQGRHNLPYYLSDLDGDAAITPYQAVVDSLLQGGNSVLTFSDGKARGRIGEQSNRASATLREGFSQLQQAARTLGIDTGSVDAWRTLLDSDPMMGRRFFELLGDAEIDGAFRVDPTSGVTTLSRWVYELMTKSPEQAEMDLFRYTLLSSYESVQTFDIEEVDGSIRKEVSYYDLKDRLHQLMWRVSADNRTFMAARFYDALFNMNNVDDFITFVNTELRGQEAPFTAWSRDVAEIDPSVTSGGWSKVLAGATRREAFTAFSQEATRFSATAVEDRLRNTADEITLTQLQHAVGNPNAESAPLLRNLQNMLDFSSSYRTSLGPAAMQRSNIGMLMGIMAHMTDKGKSASMVEVNGLFDSRNEQLKFGTEEERGWAPLTASSVEEAGQNPDMLARADYTFIDEDGTVVDWERLTAERFVELWATPKNRPLLQAIVFPSVMEHTTDGRLSQMGVIDMSLTALVKGQELHDTLYANSAASKYAYLSVLETAAGRHSVQQLALEITASKLGGRRTQLQSAVEAEMQVQETYRDLATLLRQLGALGSVAGSGETMFEAIRETAKERLAAELPRYKPDMLPKEAKDAIVEALSVQLMYTPSLDDATQEALLERMEVVENMLDLPNVEMLVNSFALEPPKKGQSKKDWLAETSAKRNVLFQYVRDGRALDTMAHWADGIQKIYAWAPDVNSVEQLPVMSESEWVDVSRAVVAHAIQANASTVVAGMENVRVGVPGTDGWLRLHDPSFGYLLDFIDKDHPLTKAAIELHQRFNRPDMSDLLAGDVVDRVLETIANPQQLGVWDDRIAEQISQGVERLQASGSPLGISQGGLGPQNETTEGMVTRRTFAEPEDGMFSKSVFSLRDLRSDGMLTVQRPGGTDQMQVSEMHGRFARSVKVNGAGGVEVNLLVDGLPNPGLEFNASGNDLLKSITPERVARAVEMYARRNRMNPEKMAVTVEFLHPADQPSDAAFANNVFFEGTVLDMDGDFFGSLDAAWWFTPGGIDPSASAGALQAAKKRQVALKQVENVSVQERKLLEAGWQGDLYGVLQRKTERMMALDLGGGRRVEPGFRNAVMKKMKTRHFVRGVDQAGQVQVLSAEEVIAFQQSNSMPALTEMELYVLSDSAYRTMMGEQGLRGETRTMLVPPDPDVTRMHAWTGTVTAEHVNNLPGLKSLERRSLFDTRAAQRRSMRRMPRQAGLDEKTKASYQRGMELMQEQAQVIGQARQQANDRTMYDNSVNRAFRHATEMNKQRSSAAALKAISEAVGVTVGSTSVDTSIDRAVLAARSDRVFTQQNMAGYIFQFKLPERSEGNKRFADPMGKERAAFGDIYGVDALEKHNQSKSKASWIGMGDFVSVDMNDLDRVSEAEINRALRWLMNTGAVISLSSTSTGVKQIDAASFLRMHGYSAVEGSSTVFEPSPVRLPMTLQARYDMLAEVEVVETASLVLGLSTNAFGLEENSAALLPSIMDRRIALASDLAPIQAWTSFSLPTPAQMSEVRHRLSVQALPNLLDLSEKQAGRELTKKERMALERDVEDARDHLNDRGLYDRGFQMRPGTILPLYNSMTGQLILYRHGMKPPRNMEELGAQFADSNTAVYGVEQLPQATVHAGEVIRFERNSQYGLRVLLSVPLQAIGDKNQIQGAGQKLLTTLPFDPKNPKDELTVPDGMRYQKVGFLSGRVDDQKKENLKNQVRNFREAFAFLGVDFRGAVAKTLFGDSFTDEQLAMVPQVLETWRRISPRLALSEVDDLINMPATVVQVQSLIKSLDVPGVESSTVLKTLDGATPEGRITRAILTYLMYEHAQVQHVLSSSGVNHPDAHRHGMYVRKMPSLLTQVFDQTTMTDPLREYLIKGLNERLDNDNAPYGWSMANNFEVTLVNKNPALTFSGYLQFVDMATSGDNPVFNAMAADRKGKQIASAQQISTAALALNARTATMNPLSRTSRRLAVQQGGDMSGQGLMTMLNRMNSESVLNAPPLLTPGEIEYRAGSRIVVESLRPEIDTSEWDAEEVKKFTVARALLAAKYGISGMEGMVDSWIRQYFYVRMDAEDVADGGNPGRIRANTALEAMDYMTANFERNMLPVEGGAIGVMHPIDLRYLWQAQQNKTGSFELKDDGQVVTSWDDWVALQYSLGAQMDGEFDLMMLTGVDGMFHLYQELGLGLKGLSSSVYKERAAELLDPETTALMTSILPSVSRIHATPELLASEATLSTIMGGTRRGLSWHGKEPEASEIGRVVRKRKRWRREADVPIPAARSMQSHIRYGHALITEGTNMNSTLKGLLNLRVALATINPMLTVGAPVEQFIQSIAVDATQLLTGDALASRIPGSSSDSRAEVADIRVKIKALAHNQKMKSVLFKEFATNDTLYNAGWLEAITHRMAKFGGMMQDPYYRMRSNTIVRRYVETAWRLFRELGVETNMTPTRMLDQLAVNPEWLQQMHPAIHSMAMNAVKDMKNMKETTLAKAVNGIIDPMVTSDHLLLQTASVLALKLPFMFINFTSSKIVQYLGLQAVDQFIALSFHGRKKGLIGRVQAAMSGRPFDENDNVFDMESVIESLNLSHAFIRAGITHSSLMAFGLMAGGLGLSGEDEEDRRRRRAARKQGFAYLHDPLDLVNDFRNADAIYLDWLPPFISELFTVPNADGKGGSRSMANMNWLLKQVFSPMIGMERFFNTGNPWEIWWGFEDAFYSFPLVNTSGIKDAQAVWMELAESALQEEAIGSPESMPKAFDFWMRSVMNLERMLLESSFINMLYIASDPWDRDPWARVAMDKDGNIQRNNVGVPDQNAAMQSYIDENGQERQGYYGHDRTTAGIRAYAENRATLAVLGTLFGKISGTDSMMRGDMAVKTRKIDNTELTPEEAAATVMSLYTGLLTPESQELKGVYLTKDSRASLEKRMKQMLIDDGMKMGLTEKKATARMWDIWKGDPDNKAIIPMKDIVWSQGAFAGAIGYTQSTKYYQQNTTYAKGPDGRVYATGIDRHSFFNLAGMNPLQRYVGSDSDGVGVDGVLNTVDKVRGINTGLRALVPVGSSFALPSEGEKVNEMLKDIRSQLREMQNSMGSGGGNGWKNYGRRGGWKNYGRRGGWKNYGRRGGWKRYGRRGGGGGGGGGSFTRLQAPERQQVPYSNDVSNISVSNPIIRRATIRRERIDSQKGRLNQWQ